MAKTYTSVPNVATGDVLTASAWNTGVAQNINNLRVPPMCLVYRTSNLTSYSSTAAITWQAEAYDTDSMWSSGTNVTIGTDGVYLIQFKVHVTATATMTAATPQILVNGTVIGVTYNTSIFSGIATQSGMTYVTQLSAGNTVAGAVEIAGGSAYIVKGGTLNTADASALSVTWLGQVS